MEAESQFCSCCGARDVPEAWKCTGCETLNTGEECIVCGLPKPVEKYEVKKEEFIPEPKPVVPPVVDKPEKKKSKKSLIAIVTVAVAVAGWLLAVELGIIPPINIELNL